MGGKGNKLLPVLALAAIALLAFVLARPSGKGQATIPPPRLAPAPDADSAADTVRSLAVKLQQIQAETEGLRAENQKLLQQGPEFANKLRTEVAEEVKRQRSGEAQDLSRRVDELAKKATGPNPPQSTQPSAPQSSKRSLASLARDPAKPVAGAVRRAWRELRAHRYRLWQYTRQRGLDTAFG